MKKTSDTWKSNPGFAYHLATDEEVIGYLHNQDFGRLVDKIIKWDMPRVMLADIWRYAILYENGGYYADLDTVCQRRIEDWIPRQEHDCDLIIALENDVHFCQWTFASSAGHPALGRVLALIKERAASFPRDIPDFVHWHTGPAVFTAGILDVLGFEAGISAGEAFRRLQTDPSIQKRAKQLNICIFDDDLFKSKAVKHQYSSQWAAGEAGYPSWTEVAKTYRENKHERGYTGGLTWVEREN